MDMQGTPIGSTNQGTKNTTDPESYQNPKREGAGAVTSDSLAAESVRAGGAFSENRNSEPLSVKGTQSTFNTTDTSGATTLDPAPDATRRDDQAGGAESGSGQKYPDALGGQGSFPGQVSDQGYTGGSTASKLDHASGGVAGNIGGSSGTTSGGSGDTTGGSSGSTGSTTGGSSGGVTGGSTAAGGNDRSSGANTDPSGSSDVNAAPGYVSNIYTEQSGKPPGKNITEGGFDADDSNNASFNTDIGSKNDPGRAAEADFQKITQSDAGGTGPRHGNEGPGTGVYDALKPEEGS